MLQILVTGWFILSAAIITNYLLSRTQWVGWYGYFDLLRGKGLNNAHKEVSILNLAFLYLAYPLILGLAALLAN